MLGAVGAAAKEFDSHLVTILTRAAGGELELRIGPGLTPASVAAASTDGRSVTFRSCPGAAIGAGIGAGIAGASSTSRNTVNDQAADATTPGVFRVGNGVSQPSVLFKVDPVFPEEARAGQVAGTVILSCVIGADGKAQEIRVVKSNGAGFDAKAIDAVSQWVFKPGMLNGVPASVRATIEVNFRKL